MGMLLQLQLMLLNLFLAVTYTSALLQFDQVPDRITNQRRATFTYDCTPLDVAQGGGCNVKVRLGV